jgi:hypothetical protein
VFFFIKQLFDSVVRPFVCCCWVFFSFFFVKRKIRVLSAGVEFREE